MDLLFSYDDLKYISVDLPSDINAYRLNGDFDGEITLIQKKLATVPMPEALRTRLRFELVIAEGMKNDYNTTAEQLYSRLTEKFPTLSESDFRSIVDSGNVDLIYRNGKEFFQNSAYSNILSTHSKFLNYISTGSHDSSPYFNTRRHENIKVMKENGSRAFKYTVHHEISLPEKFDSYKGQKLRLYFPYPAICDEQNEISLLGSSDSVFISEAKHRTAYMEVSYTPGKKYSIDYSYINRAVYKEVDPQKVDAEATYGYGAYTGEMYPQIVFTPFLKMLTREIAGDEKNPYIVAKKIYEWVTENVRYSYMREYFYIDNIPMFATLNRRGDCGVQALLFITLCRICGIPARWQSGSAVTPDRIGSHDWAMFYIAPYGWLYADPSYGGGAKRNGDDILHSHYFGNLDPDRLVCCTDFMQEFVPEKKYLRRDPYDNQSGEAEFENRAIMWGEIDACRTVTSSEEIK